VTILLVILILLILFGGGYGYRSATLTPANPLSFVLMVLLAVFIILLFTQPYWWYARPLP